MSRGAGAEGWRRWFVEDDFFDSSKVDLTGVIVERDINLSMSIAADGLGAIGGDFMVSFVDGAEFTGGAAKKAEARRSSIFIVVVDEGC